MFANPNKTIHFLIIMVFVFIGLSHAQDFDPVFKEKRRVYFKDNSFLVAVAATKQQQEKGLMFVKSLPPNSGMLFIYKDEARRCFYMKNTYIPLDIILMDRNKKVVFIKKNLPPVNLDFYETIQPQEKAMYVLELNAGSSDRIGIRLDDLLEF